MSFEEQMVCRAPAEEVFKLLWDPTRYHEWWAGMARSELNGDEVVRYMEAWPDFPYPTRVSASSDTGRVAISCLLSDIVHEWRIEPHDEGCLIAVRVELPDTERHRLDGQRAEIGASLEGLVAAASAAM